MYRNPLQSPEYLAHTLSRLSLSLLVMRDWPGSNLFPCVQLSRMSKLPKGKLYHSTISTPRKLETTTVDGTLTAAITSYRRLFLPSAVSPSVTCFTSNYRCTRLKMSRMLLRARVRFVRAGPPHAFSLNRPRRYIVSGRVRGRFLRTHRMHGEPFGVTTSLLHSLLNCSGSWAVRHRSYKPPQRYERKGTSLRRPEKHDINFNTRATAPTSTLSDIHIPSPHAYASHLLVVPNGPYAAVAASLLLHPVVKRTYPNCKPRLCIVKQRTECTTA